MTTTISKYGFPALRVALLAVCTAALAAPMTPMVAQNAPPAPPASGTQQERGRHGDGAQMQAHMLKHMTRQLNLTPDQVSQIQAIQSDEETKMQALQADTADAGKGRHQQVKAIREDQMSRTRAVLTDDQKPKFDAMLEQMKEHRQEHHHGEGNQPTPPQPPPSL